MTAPLMQQTRQAMDREVAFWRRQMTDRILVSLFPVHDIKHAKLSALDGQVDDRFPPQYDDVPGMLQRYEAKLGGIMLGEGREDEYPDLLWDDSVRIPVAWPDLEFGSGICGAILGAGMVVKSTECRTMTAAVPFVKEWSDLEGLAFDEDNVWVRRVLDCLRYFVNNATRPFAIRPFFPIEGGDFVSEARGNTQAILDLADDPPQLRDLYELGLEVNARFFTMRREIVRERNEGLFDHPEYWATAPIHAVPWLDMDTYAYCGPEIFERIGFMYKQKMIDRFGGGRFWLHTSGRHIAALAGRLEKVTDISFINDPRVPTAFEQRIALREEMGDTPLAMTSDWGEFLAALDEGSLPGGVHYRVSYEQGAEYAETARLNDVLSRVREYRA